jgi:hypothetical protein
LPHRCRSASANPSTRRLAGEGPAPTASARPSPARERVITCEEVFELASPIGLRAAVYLRKSLDRDGTGLAIARQREDCLKLCTDRGWQAVEYVDNDTSASSQKVRPAYVRMLADVEAGRFDAVVAWHLDRLHRRPVELERFIDLADRYRLALATIGGDAYLSTEELVDIVSLFANAVKGLASSPRHVFAVCADRSATWVDIDQMAPVRRLSSAHEKIANGCTWLGGDNFASVGRDLTLRLWLEAPHERSIRRTLTRSSAWPPMLRTLTSSRRARTTGASGCTGRGRTHGPNCDRPPAGSVRSPTPRVRANSSPVVTTVGSTGSERSSATFVSRCRVQAPLTASLSCCSHDGLPAVSHVLCRPGLLSDRQRRERHGCRVELFRSPGAAAHHGGQPRPATGRPPS